MEFHFLTDAQRGMRNTDSDEPIISPEAKRHIVLNLVAIVLFFMVLLGLILMITVYGQADQVGPLRYFGGIGLFATSCGVLAYLLSFVAKSGIRISLINDYQPRIDQLEARLSYLDELLGLISDHQPSGMAIFDKHNRFFFVNDVAAKRIGRSAAELIGQPPVKVLSNDQARMLEYRLTAARTSDTPIEFLDKLISTKGQTTFLQRHYELVKQSSIMTGSVMMREEDLTNVIVEKERREQMLRQVIETMVAVVDRRDPYATGHSARVGMLSRAVAEELKLEKVLVETAEIAGALMNFGKLLVSRSILTKTEALTQEELQRIRDAILTSADILEIIRFDGPVIPTLRQALERYDGTGMPKGLKGDQILITARIIAAVNSFIAFVSPRVHRAGVPYREALSLMANEAGKAHDESVLVALARYLERHAQELSWLENQELPKPQ